MPCTDRKRCVDIPTQHCRQRSGKGMPRTLTVLFLTLLKFSSFCDCHEIKLVDGVDKKGERGPNNGLTFHEPDLLSGPESLFFLNGFCFFATQDRYEYSVCPFQNITQRRIIGPSATLLGVWGEWTRNETHQRYDSMTYSNGQTCGRKGRSVQLGLSCGHPTFEVLAKSITEVGSKAKDFVVVSLLLRWTAVDLHL